MPTVPKLTVTVVDAWLKRAQAESLDDCRVWEAGSGGFGFRVRASGAASFVYRYRVGSGGASARRRLLTLGHYPSMSVGDARQEAIAWRGEIRKGADPVGDVGTDRKAENLDTVFPQWLDHVRAVTKDTTHREYVRLWRADIGPALGKLRVKDVTEADIAALHRSMRTRPVMANRVRARLLTFFDWCEDDGSRPRRSNPVVVAPYREQASERFLSPDEIAALLAALDQAETVGLAAAPLLKAKKGGKSKARAAKSTGRVRGPYRITKPPVVRPANPYAVAAVRFLLFSGWREQEVLTLRWDAIDLGRNAVSLADTKSGASWRPLSGVALSIIAELPRIEGSPYVFPGVDASQPLKEIRHVWYAVRHAAKLDGVRLHDLRHSFASVMASGGASLLVIGKALGHRDQKSTARYAKLFADPVREAADRAASDMLAWSKREPTPVTPLHQQRA